eukprot:GFUD01134477.1.p1 GENE.GFUD01134477.1~~GFUD01134477.1.p1  ORF type:complete len:188 (-),score=60.57 GFUD01134477.1:167-730(-)
MAPPSMQFPLSSVVWARQKGYPPWPAVITASPLTGHWVLGWARKRKYHCTFLAWNKEWSWVERENLKPFTSEVGEDRKRKCLVKNSKIAQALVKAIQLGLNILKEPEKLSEYLVRKEEKVEDDLEEIFVERLLREDLEDKSSMKGAAFSETSLEEMFVDSIIEETLSEDLPNENLGDKKNEHGVVNV